MALLTLVPEHDFALAILTNSILGERLTREVGRWILDEYLGIAVVDPVPTRVSNADLDEYAGLYRRPMADVEVVIESGRLMLRRTLRQGVPTRDSPLPPPGRPVSYGLYSADRIVQFDGPSRAEFVRRSDGSVGWLRFGERLHVKQ